MSPPTSRPTPPMELKQFVLGVNDGPSSSGKATGITPPRKSHMSRTPVDHVPRPPNAFMLFRSDFVKRGVIPKSVESKQQHVSRVAGDCWKRLTVEERGVWKALARDKELEHERLHPGYQYKPVKRGPVRRRRKAMSREEQDVHCEALRVTFVPGATGPVLHDPPARRGRSHVATGPGPETSRATMPTPPTAPTEQVVLEAVSSGPSAGPSYPIQPFPAFPPPPEDYWSGTSTPWMQPASSTWPRNAPGFSLQDALYAAPPSDDPHAHWSDGSSSSRASVPHTYDPHWSDGSSSSRASVPPNAPSLSPQDALYAVPHAHWSDGSSSSRASVPLPPPPSLPMMENVSLEEILQLCIVDSHCCPQAKPDEASPLLEWWDTVARRTTAEELETYFGDGNDLGLGLRIHAVSEWAGGNAGDGLQMDVCGAAGGGGLTSFGGRGVEKHT